MEKGDTEDDKQAATSPSFHPSVRHTETVRQAKTGTHIIICIYVQLYIFSCEYRFALFHSILINKCTHNDIYFQGASLYNCICIEMYCLFRHLRIVHRFGMGFCGIQVCLEK